MKRIVSFILCAALVLGLFVVIGSAENSPVKDYEQADAGELLYKFNFNGDSVFSPAPIGSAENNYTFTVGDGGASITIKGRSGGANASTNFYGGIVEGLSANASTEYLMMYKVRANGAGVMNNSVGIGGLISNGNVSGCTFYNNYSNHNTASVADRRAALSHAGGKLLDYKYFNSIDTFATDSDGFITMMLEFKGATMSSYILKDGKSPAPAKSNWIALQSTSMDMDSTDDAMGFMLYAYYNVVDTTIKDVELYKGGYSKKADILDLSQKICGEASAVIPNADGVISNGEYAVSNTIAEGSERDFIVSTDGRKYLTPSISEHLSYDSEYIYYAIEFEMSDFYYLSFRINAQGTEMNTSAISKYVSEENSAWFNVLNNGGRIVEWKTTDPKDNSSFYNFEHAHSSAAGTYDTATGKGCVEFKLSRSFIDNAYGTEGADTLAYYVKLYDTDDSVIFIGTSPDSSAQDTLDGYSGYLPRYMMLGDLITIQTSASANTATTDAPADTSNATTSQTTSETTAISTSPESSGCAGSALALSAALIPVLACCAAVKKKEE